MPRSRPKDRTERGHASRERILDAAGTLFGERGYAGTSTAAICRRARVAKTALYWHFDHKEGLLIAALERANSKWREEIQKRTYETSDPNERLDLLIAGLRNIVENHEETLCLLLSVMLEQAKTNDELREMLQRITGGHKAALSRGIEDALGRTIPNLDLVCHTVFSLLDGIMLLYRISPEETDLDRLFQNLKETLVVSVLRAIQSAETDPTL